MIHPKDVEVGGGNFSDSYFETLCTVSEGKIFLCQLNSYHFQRLDIELQNEDVKINGLKVHSIS